mmetsp:Transcript_178476/g.566257  ORF Transcript_178476/g.566257 Transcript_178476/m.566257 type:complete len:508 (-) Transcript_178476:97-1620(-)
MEAMGPHAVGEPLAPEADEGTHFVCTPCLGRHVETSVGGDLHVRRVAKGLVRCPGRPCSAPPYGHAELALRLDASIFDQYLAAFLALGEADVEVEAERRAQSRLRAELARLRGHGSRQEQAREIRKRVVEDILTVKCPKCAQAFVDFDGCFALQCGRCGCGFCAWCGKHCDKDAHAHVGKCLFSQSGGNLFGSLRQFDAALKRRRIRDLRHFLRGVDTGMREPIVEALNRDLKDLGINARTVLWSSQVSLSGYLVLGLIGVVLLSVLLNAKLWWDRHALLCPNELSLLDVLEEARHNVRHHMEGVRGGYDAFLTELRSDFEQVFFDLHESLVRGLQGDIITFVHQLWYTPAALLVCSAVALLMGGPASVLAGLHGMRFAGCMEMWYIKGGGWLVFLRLACAPVKGKWQTLMQERHLLVLKAARAGLMGVDSSTSLAFAPGLGRGRHWSRVHSVRTPTSPEVGACRTLPLLSALLSVVVAVSWPFGHRRRRRWHRHGHGNDITLRCTW